MPQRLKVSRVCLGEERQIFRFADPPFVRRALEEAGIQQRRHVAGLDRAVSDAALGAVSTSSIGSSHAMPREPFRTIVRSSLRSLASCFSSSAISSAPQATAKESSGTRDS